MIVNFSQIDLNDRPILILKKADGTPIGVLGYATDIEFEPKYNEVSVLTFKLPAEVDGVETPLYDEITGQKIVELKGIGQFVITTPKESGDKIQRAIHVQANSLESEFVRKRITLPESTYKFFDSTNVDGTILGMIMELMPNWSVGSVSSSLYNKYRTYDVNNENLYNFIKGDVQKAYNCIFDFDTLHRVVNVRDADEEPSQKQVYISRDNLAKDIEVSEKTDDLVTRLDVNGADGVDIRGVNPTGDNVIVNLDYFMNTNNFSQAMVTKYNAWKQLIADNKLPFYNLAIQYAMLIGEETAENAKLVDLQGEYTTLENIQAVIIQGIAQKLKTQADLDTANANLAAKQAQIDAKEAEIAAIETERASTLASIQAIRNACAYERYFTLAERKTLDPYIVDNAITETTFVASEVQSYTDGAGNNIANKQVRITGSTITQTTSAGGATLYSIVGGTANIAGLITGTVINAIFERRQTGKVILSLYLGAGEYSGTAFSSACVSISGTGTMSKSGGTATCNITDAYLYFSLNASDYEKKSVAWELYEYGDTLLKKMSVPSYTFSVDSANFIALSDFELFKNELELGQRIYIEIKGGHILRPICTGAKIKWSDKTYLDLMFSDTFTANDGQSKLVDILDNSISMGKTLSAGKFTYEAFTESGASSELHDFILSALDTAKNAIMSSTEQAVSWDGAGLRLRRYKNDAHTAYEPEQIWMSNNSIMMTDDGWATAKMAIGKFVDDNLGTKWGIIAPMVVGTLLAGEELVIEAAKKSGGTTVFRVDADGCRLYNAEFTIQKANTGGTTTQILLNPDVGIAMGTYPVVKQDGTIDTDKARFWVDPAGTMHLAGSIYSNDGYIGNWNITQDGLWSGSGASYVGLSSSGTYRIWAGNETAANAPFSVQQDGTLKSTKGTIGGWYIGSDYIGNKNTKAGSTVGLASGTNTSLIAFWAGGEQASAPFRVSVGGAVNASNLTITGGSITIKDGDTVMFNVTNKGKVTAKDITIEGGSITIKNDGVTRFQVTRTGKVTITDGSITIKNGDTVVFSVSDVGTLFASDGQVGGWYIGTNYIGNKNTKANSTVGMASSDSSDVIVFWAGAKIANTPLFSVTAGGKLTATNADITGKITSSEGQIGGWYLSSTHIGSSATKAASLVGLSNVTGNSVAFWAGNSGNDPSTATFRVTGNGNVYASALHISGGDITIKKDGATTFEVTSAGKVTASDLHITGGSISIDSVFSVTSAGYLTASSGKVGGWFISSDHIGNASTKANSTIGMAVGTGSNVVFWAGTDKFQVLANGKLKSSDIEISGGEINIKNSTGTVTFSVSNAGKLTATGADIKGKITATELFINDKGIDTYLDDKGYRLEASHTQFMTEYWDTTVGTNGTLTKKTKFLQDSGQIQLDAFTEGTDGTALGLIERAGITVDASGHIKLESLAENVVTDSELSTTLSSYATIEMIPGKLSLLTWDSIGNASKILLTPDKIKLASTGYLEISSGNFKVDSSGNVTVEGTVTATAGAIGGWSIGTNQLNSGIASGYVALNSNNTWDANKTNLVTGQAGEWVEPHAIWCGAASSTSAPFRVRRDGTVYIKQLYVDGELIDFTTFENAVSLSSGGSWNGNTFTATVKLWGKISKTISMTATVSLQDATYYGFFLDTKRVLFGVTVKRTVNGKDSADEELRWGSGIDCTPLYNYGYSQAAGKVSGPSEGSGNSCSITVPKTNAGEPAADDTITIVLSKDSTPSSSGYAYMKSGSTQVARLDIGSWYTDGKTAGEGQFSKAALTLQGSKKSVTPVGNAVHFKRHSGGTAPSTGYWYTIDSSSYDLTYYLAGTATDYYEAGTSYTTSNSPYYTKSSGGTCFAAGMMVRMADGSECRIEDLQAGMHVLSYNEETGSFVPSEILATQQFESNGDIFDVHLSNDKVITLTASHPMLTTEGWKAINTDAASREHFVDIGRLKVGSIIVCEDGIYTVDHISYRDDLTDTQVYNIDVEPYDTYVVEGAVVHNADSKA